MLPSAPGFLVLIPVAWALLFLFRLLRARHARVVAGSLLIWKRLEALPVAAHPKRVVLDLSLLLQAGAALALLLALAGFSFEPSHIRARHFFIVLDNRPMSRMRDAAGIPAFKNVLEKTSALLRELQSNDRVFVARSAPHPAVLSAAPLSPEQALDLVKHVTPALSGPDAASLWLFAMDRARALPPESSLQTVIVSLSSPPVEALREAGGGNASGMALWLRAVAKESNLGNIAITEAGSLSVDSQRNSGPRVMVRVENFSENKAEGNVLLEALETPNTRTIESQHFTLEPGAKSVASFRIAGDSNSALRIAWHDASNNADALPEDDSVVLAPRPERAPRICLHAPHPALEKLFRLALGAEMIPSEEINSLERGTDMDVFVGAGPERLPEYARAALFIAPERGYRSCFDVGEKTIAWPVSQRGEDSALTAGIAMSGNSGIVIPKAFEILHTGDFKTLLRDADSGRALAAKFYDEQSRPCYVFAFSPGAGLSAERPLDRALAALLVRIALEAARSGPPYARLSAAELEAAANLPLPLDWRPSLANNPALASNPFTGSGVLDEHVSELRLEKGTETPQAEINAFLAASGNAAAGNYELTPWLIALALLLASAEFFIARD